MAERLAFGRLFRSGPLVQGALAGLAGTLVYTLFLRVLGSLLKPGPSQRWAWHEARPADGPPALFFRQSWQSLRGRTPAPRLQRSGGILLHWSYGIGWGILLSLSRFKAGLVSGSLLGLLTAALSLSLGPALTLTRQQPVALSLIAHLFYGWVLALVSGQHKRTKISKPSNNTGESDAKIWLLDVQ